MLDKPLEDYFDVQIFSTVYVGSQKQPLNLIFDTGSAVSARIVNIDIVDVGLASSVCYLPYSKQIPKLTIR